MAHPLFRYGDGGDGAIQDLASPQQIEVQVIGTSVRVLGADVTQHAARQLIFLQLRVVQQRLELRADLGVDIS